MNLAENYKRLFGEFDRFDHLSGKLPKSKPTKTKLTESENKKMLQVFSFFKKQYPTSTLSVKNENITVNGLIVENVQTFLTKNNTEISRILKNFVNKTIK